MVECLVTVINRQSNDINDTFIKGGRLRKPLLSSNFPVSGFEIKDEMKAVPVSRIKKILFKGIFRTFSSGSSESAKYWCVYLS